MTEKVLAAVALLLCTVLLVRLLLSERRRWRFDAWVRRSAQALKAAALRVWHWRSSRRAATEAAAAADAAIRRARERSSDGEWEGNVYKPKSFRKPRKLH